MIKTRKNPIIYKLKWKHLEKAGICHLTSKGKIKIMSFGRVKIFLEWLKRLLGIYKTNLTLFSIYLISLVYIPVFFFLWFLFYHFFPVVIPGWSISCIHLIWLYLIPTGVSFIFAFIWFTSLLEFELLAYKFENLLRSTEVQHEQTEKFEWTPAQLRTIGYFYYKGSSLEYDLKQIAGYTRNINFKERLLKKFFTLNKNGKYVFRDIKFKVDLPPELKKQKKEIENDLKILFKGLCLMKFFSAYS